jgi:gliding motility-associated-like protein
LFRNLIIFLSLAFLSAGPSVNGQTILPGGVINQYSKVISVGFTDNVNVDNPGIFSVRDTVLLIQMKGVEISISNDNSYGNKQNEYSGGFYEFLIIKEIMGNKITFETGLLKNSYDPQGALQLVRVPGFDNVIVKGELTCEPWDSARGTGGVLAMLVGNTLSLNADIDVSSKGFKGAEPVVGDGICGYTDMFYNVFSQKSGFKGEGAVSYGYLPPSGFKIDLGSDHAKGQGPAYNGGGGGNGKYSGGSGGGNIGSGGPGGSETGSCGVSAVVGLGAGRSVKPVWEGGDRVFMGGGGGSGTQTGALVATRGGNGGGIIIILSETIVGNGFSIKSNGESVTGMATAGGAGGGAGGSVLLAVPNYSTNLQVEAKGGDGGSTNGPVCTGSGGGGGGGLFWFSDIFPAGLVDTVLINGQGGARLSSVDCNFSQWGADGSHGLAAVGLDLPLTGFLFNSVYSTSNGLTTETICEGDIPAPLLGTTPRGGTPPYLFQWQWSVDKITWNSFATEDKKDYIPVTPLLTTTYYRRVVRDNSAPQVIYDYSKPLSIIVQPKIQNNDLSNYMDSVCSGIIPDEIFAVPPIPSGGDGTYAYVWEKSEDSGATWSGIPGETGPSYTPVSRSVAAITTVIFRRIVSSGIGCPDTSSLALLTYLPSLSNIIESDQEICNGDQPSALTSVIPVGGGSGTYGYVWYESNDGLNYSVIPSENNEDMQPPVLNNGTAVTKFKYYQRTITSSACKDTSDAVLINIYPSIRNNTIGKDTSICINTAPGEIKGSLPAGGNGVYTYEWLHSTDNINYNMIIGETNPDYSPGILPVPTYFKRKVNSNACIDISTTPVFVDIHPVYQVSVSDLADGPDTVCNGGVGQVTISLTTPAGSPWLVTMGNDQGEPDQVYTVNTSPYNANVDVNYKSFTGTDDFGTVSYSIASVTDRWGCPVQNIVLGDGHVIALQHPVADAGANMEVCGSTSNLQAVLNFGKGFWTGPVEISFTDPSNPQTEITASAQGEYQLIWTSTNGTCPNMTDNTSVKFWDMPTKAVIFPGKDTTLEAFATEIDLKAINTGDIIGSISWYSSNPGVVFSPPDGVSTTASQLKWGKNEIKLKVSNGSCPVEEDKIVVTVLEGLAIPKGISPRSSFGQNDFFAIKNIGDVENQLSIFTRSGLLVFKTENFQRDGNFPNGWDGTDKNGKPLPDDTYYYVINVMGDNPRTYTGFVVIKGNR